MQGTCVFKEAEMQVWTGRVDDEGPLALRWHQRVEPWRLAAPSGVALLGFACDAGVQRNHGRAGAVEAPRVIRELLAGLPWHLERPVYDAGDVVCLGDDLEGAQEQLSVVVAKLLSAGHFPLVLGGGHEVAYGSYGGLARHLSATADDACVGIINLDAHLDMRLSVRPSSGTPFAQIERSCRASGRPFRYLCAGVAETANTAGLLAHARSCGAQIIFDEALQPWSFGKAQAEIEAFLATCDVVYLSIDMDVLPGGQAPGVSAPAAYGVPLNVLETLIDQVRASGKLVLADLAEFNPKFDQDRITARVAARLIHRLLR